MEIPQSPQQTSMHTYWADQWAALVAPQETVATLAPHFFGAGGEFGEAKDAAALNDGRFAIYVEQIFKWDKQTRKSKTDENKLKNLHL